MKDLITSGTKTAVQLGVAAFVAWLLQLGIDVGAQSQALETGAFAIATGVVGGLLNWLGRKFPIVNKIVSLGLSNSSASY